MQNNINAPSTEKEILNRYLINGSHDIKSIFGLLASAFVSSVGVYGFLQSITDTNRAFYISVVFFIGLLVVVDTIKRGTLTKYLNGLLKKLIRGTTISLFYLVIAIMGTIFMLTLDVVGSFSSADILLSKYTEHKNTDSKEFEILEANAKSGKDNTMLYIQMTNDYRADEKLAQKECNSKWHVPKYRTKNTQCMEKWRKSHPHPNKNMMNTPSTINITDYRAIESKNRDFITEYGFYIAFVLFTALTVMFQYLTIAKIYDDYREILESLTIERVSFINDTIKEYESIQAEHEQQQTEMLAQSEKEKKHHERQFLKVGEAIAITHKKKMVQTRAKTVRRIANNEYVPQEESKAGFIYNPLNESVITDEKETKPLNDSVKRIDLKEYSNDDLKLIDLLWKQSTVKRNDQLETRDNVLKIIGDNKTNTLRLRNLYKKLLADKYIYKKVSYFSDVDL